MSVQTGLPQTGAPAIGHPSSPFLIHEEAALYLRFELTDDAGHRTGQGDTVNFGKWLDRHNKRAKRDKNVPFVRKLKRGKRVMFHIDELDAAIGWSRKKAA